MKIRFSIPVIIISLVMCGAYFKPLMAGHFVPVWSGNPFNPMTIIVTEAKISGVNLVAGDEVGIFDGVSCVGRGILTQTIIPSNSSTYLYVSCSSDDPGTTAIDGFTEGHTIVYKLWKQSTNHETEFVTHTFPYSPSFVFETFVQNETAVVVLMAVNVPVTRVVQNLTVGSGQTTCYDATQIITVAGNGTVFQVLSGGNTTMVAGQKISYLPGTYVAPGGYLLGYMTTNGLYCNNMPPLAPQGIEMNGYSGQADNGLFTVFPNPTTGNFTLVLASADSKNQVEIVIYNIFGKKLIQRSVYGVLQYPLSLEGLYTGIYYVRVLIGSKSAIVKIIKL